MVKVRKNKTNNLPPRRKFKGFSTEFKRIYDSARWKHLRNVKFNRNPVCEKCKKVKGHTVDHIKPLRMGGEPWDILNLMTLCWKCNVVKTGKDAQLKNVRMYDVSLEQIIFSKHREAWADFCDLQDIETSCIKTGLYSMRDRIKIPENLYRKWVT
jgi:hypothetical protein